jgi:hypothetical protein
MSDEERVTRDTVEEFYSRYMEKFVTNDLISAMGSPGVKVTCVAERLYQAGYINALIDELNFRFFETDYPNPEQQAKTVAAALQKERV